MEATEFPRGLPFGKPDTEEIAKSHLRDSNPGLQLYESCALPTELRWPVLNSQGPGSAKEIAGGPPKELEFDGNQIEEVVQPGR